MAARLILLQATRMVSPIAVIVPEVLFKTIYGFQAPADNWHICNNREESRKLHQVFRYLF